MSEIDRAKDWPIEDLEAGLKFRDSMIPQSNGEHLGQPLWHEWAIMEAFLAGVKHAGRRRVTDA